MKRLSATQMAVILWILCIISRLPQLCSDNLVLDGDECIVAVMAKHIYVGKEFSLFFYGQQYGFSLIEELFILPFYAVVGVNALAVKLAMLLLWSLGLVFFYKSVDKLNTGNRCIPIVITLLLILTPAWAVWSMKARGGYLTAFTLSSILLFLLVRKEQVSKVSWIIAGILLVIIFESMVLWLPGMLLLCLHFLLRQKSLVKMLCFLLPATALYFAFDAYRHTLPDFHKPEINAPYIQWLDNVLRIPQYLYTSLHGNYFFFDVYPPNFFQAAFAIGFSIIVLLVIAAGIYHSRKNLLLFILILAMLCALSITVVSSQMHYRYLLPLSGLTLIALQLLLNYVKPKKMYAAVAAAFLLLGVVSIISFKDFSFTVVKEKTFRKALDYMLNNGIYYTYCHDQYLVWEINFYSNEKILSREMPKGARYPEYHERIDAALNSGKKTALVGYKDDYFGLDVKDPVFIDYIYVKENFPKAELDKNFDF